MNTPFAKFVLQALRRHFSADWGDVDTHDKAANDAAMVCEERLFSVYTVPAEILEALAPYEAIENKIWIITEWDRSATTVLFPEEY
jgi:hypothetical protein